MKKIKAAFGGQLDHNLLRMIEQYCFLKGMKKNEFWEICTTEFFTAHGYIPENKTPESVVEDAAI